VAVRYVRSDGRPPGQEWSIETEANAGFGLCDAAPRRELGDGFVVRPQEIANVAETGVAAKTWMAEF
jgi:hypothetical protein